MDLMSRLRGAPVFGPALATLERFGNDRGGYLAATVTYYGFLSLFPLLLLGFSVIGFVLAGDAEAQRDLTASLSESVPGLRLVLGENIDALVDARAASGIVGILGLLWSGLGATEAAGFAVSRVFRVQPYQAFVKRKAWALGTTVGLGLLAIASLAIVAVVGSLSFPGPGDVILRIAGPVVALGLDVALFLLAYRLLTQRQGPRFGRLWPGAILAAVGWGALKIVGTWYVARTVSNSSAVYGTLAGAVAILLLIYLASQLLIYGAELNAVRLEREGHRLGEPGDGTFVKEEMQMQQVRPNGDRSTGELVRSVAADTATLVRKEVELARQEIVEGVMGKVKGAGALGAAAIIGLFALGFLGVTMGVALAIVLPAWLAWLLTAVMFLVLTGIAAAVGLGKLKGGGVAPEKAKENMKEDVRWARAQLKR